MKKLLLIGLLGLAVHYEANAMLARAGKTAARQAKTTISSLNTRGFSSLNHVDPLVLSQSIVNLLLLGQNYLTNKSLDFHWKSYKKLRDRTDDTFKEQKDKLEQLEERLKQIKSQQSRDNERA